MFYTVSGLKFFWQHFNRIRNSDAILNFERIEIHCGLSRVIPLFERPNKSEQHLSFKVHYESVCLRNRGSYRNPLVLGSQGLVIQDGAVID